MTAAAERTPQDGLSEVTDETKTLSRSQAMCDNVKALIAKCWKDQELALEPGRHHYDEVVTIRVSGTVEKQADQLVAPTATLPLIPILALFWEKAGVTRDRALAILREAITEAMAEKANKGERIEARIKDVETAVQAVKDELIAKLPKAKRAGRVVTKDLLIEVLPVHEEQEALVPAA
jgi:hypothetical protein